MSKSFKDDYEFYASLPRKRLGTGVLIFYKNELLIVQPTYNPQWLLPGGTVEAEESPREGLRREVREGLGLTIEPTHLLAVDYVHNHDIKGEYVSFLFAAKELTEQDVYKIKLQQDTFKDYRFVEIDKALELLTPPVATRVMSALNAVNKEYIMVYLEDGKLPLREAMAFS